MMDPSTLLTGSPLPIYYQIQSFLQEDIEAGRLRPGDAILPERKLAQQYKVSVGTVRQAIAALVNGGLLVRKQGKGTFVAGTSINPASVRYYRYLRAFGEAEAALTWKLKSLTRSPGLAGVNSSLKIRAGQDLLELKRVMFIDEVPTVYSISYLPQKLFKKLEEVPASRFEKVALYVAIEQIYGLPTLSNRELLSIVLTDREVAGALKVRVGTPLLLIEMLSYTYRKQPYEYRKSFCLTRQRKLLREMQA
jgi:GntR family transcriptional regulator